MKPGYYVARQGEPDFGEALALIASGQAESVGDIYDSDGTRVVAFLLSGSGPRRNPSSSLEALGTVGVKLGSRFFTNVLRDYEENFGEKWWREAIQNAVDAGARQVQCFVEDRAGGTVLVTCEDDGSGMDQDTLIRAMLTLGGSTKEEGTSTFGGFGRAKELLLLPWLEYTIHTRDLSYTSHNDEPSTLYRAEPRRGTRLSVLMPGERHATAEEAISYIRRCRLPRVRFTVNGEEVTADLGKGTRKLREFSYEKGGRTFKAKVYSDPKDQNYPSHILVRINGLYMFQDWADKPPDLVLIDLEGAAVDMLTSNRDGFAHQELRRDVRGFAAEVAKERKQALQAKQGIISQEFIGGERFAATERDRLAWYDQKILRANRTSGSLLEGLGSMDDPKRIRNALEQITSRGLPEEEMYSTWMGPSDTETLAKLVGSVKLKGSAHAEAVASLLAWSPDYYIHNEVVGFKVPKKFWPETMTSEVRRLMRLWAELCRFVLMQLGCSRAFGVGVIFSGSVLAAYKETYSDTLHRRLEWLLLNPAPRTEAGDETILDPRNDEGLLNLYALAIHEATHMADEVSSHDVDFAAALTRNISRTYVPEKVLRDIRRSVLKYDQEVRREIRERKTRVIQEAKKPTVMLLDDSRDPPNMGSVRRRIWETFVNRASPQGVLVMLDEYSSGGGALRFLWQKKPNGDEYNYGQYALPAERFETIHTDVLDLMADWNDPHEAMIMTGVRPSGHGSRDVSVADALYIFSKWLGESEDDPKTHEAFVYAFREAVGLAGKPIRRSPSTEPVLLIHTEIGTARLREMNSAKIEIWGSWTRDLAPVLLVVSTDDWGSESLAVVGVHRRSIVTLASFAAKKSYDWKEVARASQEHTVASGAVGGLAVDDLLTPQEISYDELISHWRTWTGSGEQELEENLNLIREHAETYVHGE